MRVAKEYKKQCPVCKVNLLVPIWKYCDKCGKDVNRARAILKRNKSGKKETAWATMIVRKLYTKSSCVGTDINI